MAGEIGKGEVIETTVDKVAAELARRAWIRTTALRTPLRRTN